jgi:hypothetical protein
MRHHDMWGSAFGTCAMLSGVFGSEGPRLMQDLTNGLPRTPLPRTPVNKGHAFRKMVSMLLGCVWRFMLPVLGKIGRGHDVRFLTWAPRGTGGASGATGYPEHSEGCSLEARLLSMTQHGQMRWYNPSLEGFEWREVPPTDERALEALEGSPHSLACANTYREWRQLGASIEAALIRAGEAAKERSDDEKREGEVAPYP